MSLVIALHIAIPSGLSGSVDEELTSVKTLVEVDQSGSFTQTTVRNRSGSISFNQSNGIVTRSSPNIQWIINDGGLFYIPTRVALAARGNQAFYGCYLNNERTRLFSTTTTLGSNAPVWDDGGLYEASSDIYVDASDDGNVLSAIAQFAVGGDPTNREVVLFKYLSDSSTPDWTYTFPDTINAGARIKVSKDGTFIAAALTDEEAGTLKISYFNSASPTPLFTDSFTAGYIRALDMTDDGSLLYLNEGTMIHIYETATQSIIYSVDAGASFDSHTISGDGNRFAFGGFNFVKCYQWNGTTYEFQFQYFKSGQVYCARCDLSGDAGTLAATFYNYGTGLEFWVESIDATNGTVNFEATFSGAGSYQNNPQQVVTNADGSRIVYGGWGDQFNTNPEVMVFEGGPVPVAAIDTRGSVFDVDMSSNGVFVASGSKSIHANISGNGGDHACLYMGDQDLYLDGVPALSNMVTFNIEGTSGENVLLAGSLNEVAIPMGIGTLIVDPDNYVELGTGTIPPSGLLEIDVRIPGNPSLLGRKVATQALITGGTGPHLTNGQVFWILP
jgi:hypothetical protein